MLRRSRFAALPTLLLLLGASACGSSEDTPNGQGSTATSGGAGGSASSASTGSGAGGSGGGSFVPPGEALKLSIEPFDVQPGTERQVCKTINLPTATAIDVVMMRSTMVGVSHHFNAYKVLTDQATAPVDPSDEAVHDCAPAAEQLGGDAAYIFGSAAPERVLELPAGVAFHLEAGHRIILEQHVINTTANVLQGGVDYELYVEEDPEKVAHHADILWLANWSFFIPPNGTTSDTTHCVVPYPIEVFGLTSHTHALGSHFSIEKWSESGTSHLYDSYDWQHPPYMDFAPTFALEAGEGFEWTCTWDNPTDQLVGPGKESTDEMCMTFAYAYPRDTLSAPPYQCNE
jgi:hypothetical protein